MVCAENRRFETTDMLCSVKMGLRAVGAARGWLFFMPVDAPLFAPETLEKMKAAALAGGHDAIIPTHRGRSGHPILLARGAAEKILDYEGEGGLGGALKNLGFDVLRLECGDFGILPDADSPGEYALMRLLHGEGVPDKVVRHEKAVARLAVKLADELIERGYELDTTLVELAALVHDCARTEKDHAARGAERLREIGREDIARVVRNHMLPEPGELGKISETTLVYLADKLVLGDAPATLEERFLARLERYEDAEARRAIEEKYEIAKKTKQIFEAALRHGIDAAEILNAEEKK